MKTGRYSVGNLLTSTDIEQIIIPEIQRDYVWKKKNVEGLLKSILDKFNKRINLELEIKNSEGAYIEDSISKHLKEEYNRLKFNTRVGFIYAYHSQDYAGRYYLIDGQQRMTTLFLMLLAAYKNAGMQNDFRKKYFGGSHKFPKIDYKVREVSHDFLVDFIDHELMSNTPFSESTKYYCLYEKDVTAKNLIDNYYNICDYLKSDNDFGSRYSDLVEYIENYIEFNYFDTNICQQGERLYLYMNSRGESLSIQERLRPLIVGREKSKKFKVGRSWEEWQDFFWQNRGTNTNADKGFQEFCKWATLLHMMVNSSSELKPADYEKKKGKDVLQNRNEIIDDYITIETEEGKRLQQEAWIRDYQEKNTDFDYHWLESVFEAVKRLNSFKTLNNCFKSTWLSKVEQMIEYICILPCIMYLINNSNAEEIDCYRLCMFLKNTTDYENVNKIPQTGVRNTVEMVLKMKEKGITDIADLDQIQNEISKSIFIEADSYKLKCMKGGDRDNWEKIFWDTTNDSTFNNFIQGDTIFFFRWKGCSNYADFQNGLAVFKSKIIDNRNYEKPETISCILKYGDFILPDNGGSGNLKVWMPRYVIVRDKDDWYRALKETKITGVLENYLEGKCFSPGTLYHKLIEGDKNSLGYMGDNRMLIHDKKKRIVLLKGTQASETGSFELMPYWVERNIKNVWNTTHRVCVLDFNIIPSGITTDVTNEERKFYFINMKYCWNSDYDEAWWNIEIAHRKQNENKSICPETEYLKNTSFIKSPTDWIEKDGKYVKEKIVVDDFTKSISERINTLKDTVNSMFKWPVLELV